MASLPSIARRLCGRRQDEEVEEILGLPVQEERGLFHQRQEDVFEAIVKCNLERIKSLKEQFSFKDIKDRHERTPLHVLADLKHEEKKVKDEDLNEIFMVLREAGCDVNCVDEFGNTAVKLAAEKGCIQVLKCLLEEKADIEISDKYKQDTPLHWAAKSGMFEATQLLIKHKAHLNPQNADLHTPLHLAVQKKHINIVYLLLLAGADKKLKDKNDATPLCIAEKAGNKEIEELLNKSEEELNKMLQQTKDGQGEYVEADSGVSIKNSMPLIPLGRATVLSVAHFNVNYHVNVGGQATAAIGPNAKVINEQSSQASLASSPQAQQLPPPALLPLTAGSPTASSPTPAAQQLSTPTPTPSTAGRCTASSPAAVVPTAPLSPLPMDIPSPLPSAPPVEGEDDTS